LVQTYFTRLTYNLGKSEYYLKRTN